MIKRDFKGCISIFLCFLMTLSGIEFGVKTVSAAGSGGVTQFNIMDGDIIITDSVSGSAIKVTYGAGQEEDNIDPATMLTITGSSDSNNIVINTSNDRTVNVTLSDTSIELTGDNESPFELQNNSVADLTLSGMNILTAGLYGAGLNVPANAAISIGGSGELTATGGAHGAGIGGNSLETCGNITITGGTVRATTYMAGMGAGIGGGACRAGGSITITGGTVVALGGSYGAGIGGGGGIAGGDVNGGAGGDLTISGGNVTAVGGHNGGNGGAGIGGGRRAPGGIDGLKTNLNISNTASVTAVGIGVLTKGEAIEAAAGSVIDSSILMADYSGYLISGQNVYVKDSTGENLIPAVEYDNDIVFTTSIALTVPSAGDYTLFTDAQQQRQGAPGSMSQSFSINTGLNIFNNVQNVLNLSINYPGEKLTGYSNVLMQYSTDGVDYITDTDLSGSISELIPAAGAADLNLKVREAAHFPAPAGDPVDITVPARPASPAAINITISAGADETHTNITLANIYEYYIGASAPVSDTVWTTGSGAPAGVAAADGQKVYIRTKATDHSFVSGYTDCGTVKLGAKAAPVTPIPTSPPVIIPGPTSAPASGTEQITVDVKEGFTDTTAAQITIERSTDEAGMKSDTVTYQEDKAVETVNALKQAETDTARIVIPDAEEEISETTVNIPSAALEVLSEGEINLQIDSEPAKINIPKEALEGAAANLEEILYFNIVPVREEQQKEDLTKRALLEAGTICKDSNHSVSIMNAPVMIDTNMPSSEVDITLPLTGVDIPADPAEREAFLDQLAVYIEHSDGEKELLQGEIVDYREGALGIKFHIMKFSTFTVVKTDVFVKSSECNVISVTEPSAAVISETDISASVANKISSITVQAAVSEKAVWGLYTDNACVKVLNNNNMELRTGNNTAYLKVTAEDGTVKIYTLTVYRNKSSEADIIRVSAPKGAAVNGKSIEASVGYNTDAVIIKAAVSENAVWKLYSDKSCRKELTEKRMIIKTGTNKAYLKVTAEDGMTSKVYTVIITREAAPAAHYNAHIKLGVIGSRTYAETVAKIFGRDYNCGNIAVIKEGKYYRVYLDFVDITAAKAACNDMVKRKYIVNYYFIAK